MNNPILAQAIKAAMAQQGQAQGFEDPNGTILPPQYVGGGSPGGLAVLLGQMGGTQPQAPHPLLAPDYSAGNRMMDQGEQMVAGAYRRSAPKYAPPAFRTEDALAGGLPALLLGLFGQGDAATQYLGGYMQGKFQKSDRRHQEAMSDFDRQAQGEIAAGQGLIQRGQRAISAADQQYNRTLVDQQKAMQAIDGLLARADKQTPATVRSYFRNINALAARAGLTEINFTDDDVKDFTDALSASKGREDAMKLIPQALKAINSPTSEPGVVLLNAMFLKRMATQHGPEFMAMFSVDPETLDKVLADATEGQKKQIADREYREFLTSKGKMLLPGQQTLQNLKIDATTLANNEARIREKYLPQELSQKLTNLKTQEVKMKADMANDAARVRIAQQNANTAAARATASNSQGQTGGLTGRDRTEWNQMQGHRNTAVDELRSWEAARAQYQEQLRALEAGQMPIPTGYTAQDVKLELLMGIESAKRNEALASNKLKRLDGQMQKRGFPVQMSDGTFKGGSLSRQQYSDLVGVNPEDRGLGSGDPAGTVAKTDPRYSEAQEAARIDPQLHKVFGERPQTPKERAEYVLAYNALLKYKNDPRARAAVKAALFDKIRSMRGQR